MKNFFKNIAKGFTSPSEERRANLFAWHPSDGGAKAPRAFTLLLAVLIASVLIALGSAIFDIVSKEITLSSSGRESQFSFYAADTGIECALYWDLNSNVFSTTTVPASQVTCGGIPATTTSKTITNPGTMSEQLKAQFTFTIGGVDQNRPCATVILTRTYYPTRTILESYGYNTCNNANALQLERAIRVVY